MTERAKRYSDSERALYEEQEAAEVGIKETVHSPTCTKEGPSRADGDDPAHPEEENVKGEEAQKRLLETRHGIATSCSATPTQPRSAC